MAQASPPTAEPRPATGWRAFVLALVPAAVTANHISVFRIMCTLAIAALELSGASIWLIIVMGFMAGFSDLLDGLVARQRGQVSNLGSVLDPLGDKLFALALLFIVFRRGWVHPYLLLAVLALEAHVLILTPLLILKRLKDRQALWPPPRVRPNKWGKYKTAAVASGLGLVIISRAVAWPPLGYLGLTVLGLGLALGLMALVWYFKDWPREAVG